MLKRLDSPYGVGRVRGRVVEVEDRSVHDRRGADLRAGAATAGARASTPITRSASWDDGELVPFAKAYSGLTDEEIRQVDAFVRAHTLEKFGPVRTREAGAGLRAGVRGDPGSTRHKSGVAVRFPRMLRWRTDKRAAEADTLENLVGQASA